MGEPEDHDIHGPAPQDRSPGASAPGGRTRDPKNSDRKSVPSPRKFRRKRAGFTTISNLVDKLVSDMGLDKRLKEHALMSLWPALVGDTLAAKSRCLFIDHEGKLVVTVRDASVGQELSLMKRELMRKVGAAAHGLEIKIEGMRFDLKHFFKNESHEFDSGDLHGRSLPKPSATSLEAVILSEDELEQIADFQKAIRQGEVGAGTEFSKELNVNSRVARLFEHELRLRKWQKQNGYPQCSQCSQPVLRLHSEKLLCRQCFFASLSV